MGLFSKKPKISVVIKDKNGKVIPPASDADWKKQAKETKAILDLQDKQLAAIQKAEAQYKEDNNIDTLIAFWEGIWNKGGLAFDGMHWMFRLPDLYIKVKRYNDALQILDRITKPMYADKVTAYRAKIAQKINK